jgi:hypothetical protein
VLRPTANLNYSGLFIIVYWPEQKSKGSSDLSVVVGIKFAIGIAFGFELSLLSCIPSSNRGFLLGCRNSCGLDFDKNIDRFL